MNGITQYVTEFTFFTQYNCLKIHLTVFLCISVIYSFLLLSITLWSGCTTVCLPIKLGYFQYFIMNKSVMNFPPHFFTVVTRTSSTMLNKSGESRYLHLFLILGAKDCLSTLSMMLALDFLIDSLYQAEVISFYTGCPRNPGFGDLFGELSM